MRMPFSSQILAIGIHVANLFFGLAVEIPLCKEEFDEGRQHVCNFSQSIHDIRYTSLTRLLGMKVETYQLPTLPTSCGLLLPPAVGLWPLATRYWWYQLRQLGRR
jgi:hypothetical protein